MLISEKVSACFWNFWRHFTGKCQTCFVPSFHWVEIMSEKLERLVDVLVCVCVCVCVCVSVCLSVCLGFKITPNLSRIKFPYLVTNLKLVSRYNNSFAWNAFYTRSLIFTCNNTTFLSNRKVNQAILFKSKEIWNVKYEH